MKNIDFHFNEVGRKPPTFGDAANVALVLLQAGFEQNNRPATLYYNTFRYFNLFHGFLIEIKWNFTSYLKVRKVWSSR